MTYVVSAPIDGHDVADVLLWDTAEPYHYVRLAGIDAGGTRRLIVGGEDHKTGHARDGAERFARLERWARERFPEIGPFDRRWAGQVFEPADLLAFIGRDPLGDENVFIGTGFSGNGYTYGTLAGLLVRDLVCGRDNPWRAVYDPGRFPADARSVGRLVRENLDVAARYADWLRPGEVTSETAIAAGDGAIVRRGLDRIAVYRDVDGTLHRCHAACPHLGCSVAWNPAERTWDCPCHGSRFTATGRLIVGPANDDLRVLEARRDGERNGEQDQV
jgi:nitrite reductase/ring-hydroxylating ferredoxin subunit